MANFGLILHDPRHSTSLMETLTNKARLHTVSDKRRECTKNMLNLELNKCLECEILFPQLWGLRGNDKKIIIFQTLQWSVSVYLCPSPWTCKLDGRWQTMADLSNTTLSIHMKPHVIADSVYFFVCQELPECERVKVLVIKTLNRQSFAKQQWNR